MLALNSCTVGRVCQITEFTQCSCCSRACTLCFTQGCLEVPGELGLWVRVQKHLRALLQLISACTSNSRILREPAVRKVQCFSPDLTQSQPEQKHVRDLRTKQVSGAISNFKRSAEQFQFTEKLQVTETNRQISLNGIRVAFKVTLNALSPCRTLISECNVLHVL